MPENLTTNSSLLEKETHSEAIAPLVVIVLTSLTGNSISVNKRCEGHVGHCPGQFLITCVGFLSRVYVTPMLTSLWLLKLTIAACLIYRGSINTSSAP